MREVDPELQAHLSTGATTMARAWIVERADGTVMGFTDHDRPLTIDGVICEPGTGMDATAVESTTGLAVDNSQAAGALSSAGITELDIERGLFDSATITVWQVNWAEPTQRILSFRGTLGEIRRSGGAFEAELRGLAEALNRPVGRVYMRRCDCIAGDARCGFNPDAEGFYADAEVDFFIGRKSIEVLGLADYEPEWFLNGPVKWLSGANKDADGLIRVDRLDGSARIFELWEETKLPIQRGDTIRLYAGCDRTAEMCAAKFDNFLNFRGFPHIPGEDWSVAYPVRGTRMDGESRET